MKLYIISFNLFILGCLAGAVHAAHSIVPHQVGGFVLGDPIEKYKDSVDFSSRMNVRYREYLYEVEIKSLQGFKSGLIAVSNCADPGKIIRIKLKYEDDGKDFFNELLKRYKARFGKPTEYQGDPFRVVIVWKWRFIDEDQNQINLVLQHNLLDEDEKIGNTVKMTYMTPMEKERECFLEKERRKSVPVKEKKRRPTILTDWDRLIPK